MKKAPAGSRGQRDEIGLKGFGPGLPAWLAYRVKAASAEEAVEAAREMDANV